MMDDQEMLLKQVFGESSDSEDYEQQQPIQESVCEDGTRSTVDLNPIWEPIKEINGLWLCRDFLSPQQQSTLLSAIQNAEFDKFSTEGWFTVASNNQAMRFGDLPYWAIELSNSIREVVVLFGDQICESTESVGCGDKGTCIMPKKLLWREPLFDQLIVNVYQPGEGICAHVDLMRFEDGIAIVSLESSCVMHFTRVEEVCENGKGAKDQHVSRVPVHLTPGSVVLLWGDARYLWKHEINRKPGFQIWEGKELNQKTRTSITLRKLCCDE